MPDEVLTKARVIVIDDSPANVAVLERLLRGAGVGDVHGITDARLALDAITELEPDLIVLDLHMPHTDGFEVLGTLESRRRRGDFLPVLVMTADVTSATRERALAAGAKDFLTKPFERTEVMLRARNLLETRSLYQRLQLHNIELKAAVEEHAARERAAAATRAASLARIERARQPGALAMVFQPIVDLMRGTVVGMEALSRFRCEPQRPPNEWFSEAADVGRGIEFELASIRAALTHMDRMRPDTFLSLNVSPEAALSDQLGAVLSGVPANRIVLELTEHQRVEDYDRLLGALGPLKAAGVRIAVDDAGAGYAGLQHILRLSPDIVKLDNALTRNIDSDFIRRALAAALVTFAEEMGAVILAEGIETQAELRILRALGVPWGQGFELAKPGSMSSVGTAIAFPEP